MECNLSNGLSIQFTSFFSEVSTFYIGRYCNCLIFQMGTSLLWPITSIKSKAEDVNLWFVVRTLVFNWLEIELTRFSSTCVLVKLSSKTKRGVRISCNVIGCRVLLAFYRKFFIILSSTSKLGPFRAKSLCTTHIWLWCRRGMHALTIHLCIILSTVTFSFSLWMNTLYIKCETNRQKTFSQKWCK